MKKSYLILLIMILSLFYINPEIFKFKHIAGSKQRIEATIHGEQYQNEQFVLKYEQKYKTIREIKDIKDDTATIEDSFYFYNTNTLATQQVYEIKDYAVVTFTRNNNGSMQIATNEVFPTLRNVPSFPSEDIQPGYKWTKEATEVQDLFGNKFISKFPLLVNYTFIGYENVNNKKLAKFEYNYQVDIINNYDKTIDPHIRRVAGESKTIMYFDNEIGSRVKEEYSRDYQFLLEEANNQSVVEFVDKGERIWYPIELLNKDKMVKDITEQLKKENVQDAEVKKDDKGVKISLENLHFKPDSSELVPEDTTRLDKIAKILNNYKKNGIMVIGHTTDKGTEKGRLKLSVERAKVIVDYLIDLDSINVLKSSFGGKGGTEPLVDNTTEEGMKKNRRVEIYILEE